MSRTEQAAHKFVSRLQSKLLLILRIPTFNMVLTAGHITSFFEDANQMALQNRTRTNSLVAEGIVTVYELKEWNDDDWD